MKGRYPVCCLFLEIDPAAVDVNIHPAKREVKFHREAEVRRLTAQAVRQVLLAFHGTESAKASTPAAIEKVPAPGGGQGPGYAKTGSASQVVQQRALPNFPPALRPAPTETERSAAQQPALHMGFRPPPPVGEAVQPSQPESTPASPAAAARPEDAPSI